MKYALVEDIRTEAMKGARGICPCCGSEMIAKYSEQGLVVNHWAHKSRKKCDHWWENEKPWHREWKNYFAPSWQEVIHTDNETGEKHIADVKTEEGWVVEFQHSYIKPEERQKRTEFYKKIVWVVDGTRRVNDVKQFQRAFDESRKVKAKLLFHEVLP